MTVTDQIKILDDKIKSSQAQYDWNREEAKTSALSSKTLLDKYEYLSMSLNKAFKNNEVGSFAKSKSDFSCDSNHNFFIFYRVWWIWRIVTIF